jgi:4-alpha-glucanotransferase
VATDGWGIEDGWHGVDGRWRPTPPGTRDALRVALGGDPDDEHPPWHRPVWVVRPGAVEALGDPCLLTLEDGTALGTIEALPADLPLGYHHLEPREGGPGTHLIVSPGRCFVPENLRTWGVTVQVPSARSRLSWGIGDLADLRALAAWLAGRGAGVMGLSPLHAPAPVGPPAASPYYPSSRRWCSPLLIRVDEVPGAGGDPVVARHGAAARALLAQRVIDRAQVWGHQRAALEHLWERQPSRRDPGGELARWRTEQGSALQGWATYAALAEHHGPSWRTWPAELRHPGAPAVQRAAADLADRVGFHAWLQWLVATQLERVAAEGVRLIQDLAIGADPAGADSWWWQDLLALDARVGAPPDFFAPDGQDWGLPPFRPWALRDAGYRPLAELVRAAMTAGGGLRVDHVMGLTRLFCIPEGATPAEGTYLRYPGAELLEVLALESARARAVVVGEDLGTVEEGFRDLAAGMGLLSTRLVWFEDDPPERFPVQAMAALTTHDLPTVAGVWTGADAAELARLGALAAPGEIAALHRRLRDLSGLDDDADAAEVAVAVYRRLGASPAMVAMATLEDALGVRERPNVPGTIEQRPNWSLALPVPVDELPGHPLAERVLAALAAGRTSDRCD